MDTELRITWALRALHLCGVSYLGTQDSLHKFSLLVASYNVYKDESGCPASFDIYLNNEGAFVYPEEDYLVVYTTRHPDVMTVIPYARTLLLSQLRYLGYFVVVGDRTGRIPAEVPLRPFKALDPSLSGEAKLRLYRRHGDTLQPVEEDLWLTKPTAKYVYAVEK